MRIFVYVKVHQKQLNTLTVQKQLNTLIVFDVLLHAQKSLLLRLVHYQIKKIYKVL